MANSVRILNKMISFKRWEKIEAACVIEIMTTATHGGDAICLIASTKTSRPYVRGINPDVLRPAVNAASSANFVSLRLTGRKPLTTL